MKAKGVYEGKPSGSLDGISDRLRELEQRYKNRKEATDAFNVNRSAFDKWVTSKAIPSLEALAKIAKVAGVSLDWLAFGEGGPSAEHGAAEVSKRSLIDVGLVEDIINKHKQLYRKLAHHISADLEPSTAQIISAYNKVVLIADEDQRQDTLQSLVDMHGETIIQMSEATQKTAQEILKAQQSN